MKIVLLCCFVAASIFVMLTESALAADPPANLFVAANGRDDWSGRLSAPNRAKTDGPFATLERARDEIRAWKRAGKMPPGGAVVEIRAGTYERSQPFALTAEDSGTKDAPIVYRAEKGREVRISGGRRVAGWKPVTDPAVLSRLEPAARGKVVQSDLRAQGITDLAGIQRSNSWGNSAPGLELFFNDAPMTLARWPNEGFTKIADVLNLDPVDVRGTKGDKTGKFVYEGDRPKRWAGEKDIWLHGYWFWDWADQREPVESIDTEKRILSIRPPYHSYGYRKGQWFYAFNLLSELDRPGEWYLDRDTGILYFWPPSEAAKGRAVVSVAPSLVTLENVSHVTLRGLTLEGCRATAVTANGGTGVRVAGCIIRNTGAWAVRMNGMTDSGVSGCDIYQTGEGGISLDGGDRKTLTPANLYADNNHIHHYSRWNPVYKAGVSISGVGQRVTHNLIHNAPHMAIGFSGNDHRIEFNEIHSVCFESNDAGAMYAGRNWTMRGTVIRHNYLHHISGFEGRGAVGVYLDDQWSGTQIFGNLFYKVTRAAMIGGGRDCTIENNVFVDCVPATHVDARGLGWAAGGFDGLKQSLEAMPYRERPWSERYPHLLTLLSDEPMAPKGNVVARNIAVGGKWGDFEGKARPYVRFENNLIDEDPKFVNAAKGDFRLRPDSPAWKLGFQRLPIERMGLYKSDERASWPVRHTPRPMPEPPAAQQPARAAGPPPVYRVSSALSPAPGFEFDVTDPAEWEKTAARPLVIEQAIQGEKAAPATVAYILRDRGYLVAAFDNRVDPSKPLRTGATWGQDDAVEIAVRNPAAGKDAPILVLRGYPNGQFESSGEAGASPAAVRRAAEGVTYRARIIGQDRWVCSWRIPLASLGIDPAKLPLRLAVNLSVRKTAGDQWLMWRGTGGYTWDVDRAGVLELAR